MTLIKLGNSLKNILTVSFKYVIITYREKGLFFSLLTPGITKKKKINEIESIENFENRNTNKIGHIIKKWEIIALKQLEKQKVCTIIHCWANIKTTLRNFGNNLNFPGKLECNIQSENKKSRANRFCSFFNSMTKSPKEKIVL